MKKIILIGATLLATSGAILIANNGNCTPEECCDKTRCEQGVCKPTDIPIAIGSPGTTECCKR